MSKSAGPIEAQSLLQQAFEAHRRGQLALAARGYEAVLACDPQQLDALHLLGVVRRRQGRAGEAESLIRRALALNPGLTAAQYNLGNLLNDLGRYSEAIEAFRQAVAQDGLYVDAWYGMGNAQRELGDLSGAASSFGKAIELDPRHMQSRHNRANILRELGDVDGSITDLRRVLELAPDLSEAHYNLALSLFLAGRYREGRPHYACRFQTPGFSSPDRKFSQPLWNGEPAPQATLLLYAEQGLGDTLQFVRYAREIRAKVGKLIIEVPRPLVRLVSDSFKDCALILAQGEPLPPFDLQLPMLGAVGLFGDAQEMAKPQPYLTAQPERIEYWAAALDRITGAAKGLRVGINWQGNPKAKIDRGRSIRLRELEPVLSLPGLSFVSLQKNAGLEQLTELPAALQVHEPGPGFDEGADAFLDSAALLMSLDLFITSDTALAHLAGALGRPVWLLLKHIPDWRWGLSGQSSPWYPQMLTFRQAESGDWTYPVDLIVKAIKSWQDEPIQQEQVAT